MKVSRKELVDLDPFDPNLTDEQKQMILDECKTNVAYFMIKCCGRPQETSEDCRG